MDFYIVLGLERTASAPEIKRAYRRLARRFHPDINPGDGQAEVRFRQILDAYETLIDPDRRRRYDSGQTHPPRAGEGAQAYGFTGFDFSGGSVHGDRATTFGDLFEDVLARSGRRSSTPERGADLHAHVSIAFEEAWRGVDCPITVTRHERCRACGGVGHVRVAEAPCVACEGTGTVRTARGHMVFTKNCGRCDGTGRQRHRACGACHGQCVETRTETITVRVPAGVADGVRVRVPGKGHAGLRGGDAGDLFVDVHVRPHRLFRRDGYDVHMTIPVALDEAVLGARIEIPTPDGPARVRVVPGTQSGQRLRLRGRGAVSPRDGHRGDLIIEMRLTLPRVLDERSKDLIRQFGQINNENVRSDLLRGD